MPELDGPAFYRLLQERKPGLSRRLLFTTGDTLARDTARFLEQVDLPNLAKPFHVDELRAAVSNAISDLEKATPAPVSSRAQEGRTGR
jgi:DNA-binding response OmpR family regulator